MAERRRYEMTEADLAALIEASRPVPYLVVGGMEPPSRQDNANRVWRALGTRMRFDYLTVQPVAGEGQRVFTAVPTEAEVPDLDDVPRYADGAFWIRTADGLHVRADSPEAATEMLATMRRECMKAGN